MLEIKRNNIELGKPALFIDRDGTINEQNNDCPTKWDEFKFLPNSLEALTYLSFTDYIIVIITNQSIIGRKGAKREDIFNIHLKMIQAIEMFGGRIDAIFLCPHSPHIGCFCRKPRPGLIFEAQKYLDLAMEKSVFIGDSFTDMMAAKEAKIDKIFVKTGKEAKIKDEILKECKIAKDLLDAVSILNR